VFDGTRWSGAFQPRADGSSAATRPLSFFEVEMFTSEKLSGLGEGGCKFPGCKDYSDEWGPDM
jgi:hypothetical protein